LKNTNEYIDVMDYMEDIKLMNNTENKDVLLNLSNLQEILEI